MSKSTASASFEDARPLVLSENPLAKVRKLFHYDERTGDVQIQSQQMLDPVLEANAEAKKDAPTNWRGNLHRVASIPIAVWAALPDDIKNDQNELRKWLDQIDQKPFRTRGGSIS